MSALLRYITKVSGWLKRDHSAVTGNRDIERMMADDEIKSLYVKGWHPRRTAQLIADGKANQPIK